MGTYLLHCSLLWLCKNIFKGKDIVTKWGSLRLFLEQEEVCASGCLLGNGCLHSASFHPNILATGVCLFFFFLSKKQSKRTTITSLCSMLFVVNLTGMFQAPLHARHFFQNGTICPCLQCLSSIAGETVNIIST